MKIPSLPIESTILWRWADKQAWAKLYLLLLELHEKHINQVTANEVQEKSNFAFGSTPAYVWQLLRTLSQLGLIIKLTKKGDNIFVLKEELFIDKEKMKKRCEQTVKALKQN